MSTHPNEQNPDTNRNHGGLSSAHRGYMYQDISTAYLWAWALFTEARTITVDRKEYDGDIFDDLTIVTYEGKRFKRQFKSSDDDNMSLEVKHFRTQFRNLRIDNLVHSFELAGDEPADEYRICCTWSDPVDRETRSHLLPCTAPGTFEGHPTKRYRLNPEILWPSDCDFRWSLKSTTHEIRRDSLIRFCDRFVIELECPQISSDLDLPGPLERLLLEYLTNRIGIGRYPNDFSRVVDVAARLISRCNTARSRQESIEPRSLLSSLGLRSDFGRVAQRFPIIPELQVNRDDMETRLRNHVLADRIVLVTGLPGSGKSWMLTSLAQRLRSEGHLVARHYCYIEPGDQNRESRITTDVLYANLIAELVDADPSLYQDKAPRLSAGAIELEKLLTKALNGEPDRKVILIVDGLDHVERILNETHNVARGVAQIANELVTLQMPAGTCLVIGSQSGTHLNPFLETTTPIELDNWSMAETNSLIRKVLPIIQTEAIGDTDLIPDITEAIHARSEGNPLYATYLCRMINQSFERIQLPEVLEFIREAPQLNGDITNYYSFIIGKSDPNAIARLLAVLDFGVTELDLKEMLPPFLTPDISRWMRDLTPILTKVSSQGGYRIYHESFRRFVIEHPSMSGLDPTVLYGPIIEWLSCKDFFDDARSYRFLFKYLNQSGECEEIINHVEVNFVAKSVAEGYTSDAIVSNLSIAFEAAAKQQDWARFARLIELRRSVTTCFQEKIQDYELFGKSFGFIHGFPKLAERLLFDGRPAYPHDAGIVLCSICDDEGIKPPWGEFLKLKESIEISDQISQAAIARFHGSIRVNGTNIAISRFTDTLQEHPDAPKWYVKGILDRIIREGCHEAIASLIDNASTVPDQIKLEARIALANSLKAANREDEARMIATDSIALCESSMDYWRCIEFGAIFPEPEHNMPNLTELAIELTSGRHHYIKRSLVESWVACVSIAARTNPILLDELRPPIRATSWFKAWLNYVIELARAEQNPDDAETIIVEQFRTLSQQRRPNSGVPRNFELYEFVDVIHLTLKRGLTLIKTREGWNAASDLLTTISIYSTSYLQGGPGGPLTKDALIKLLEPFNSVDVALQAICNCTDRLIEEARKATYFYELQAELEMYRAITLSIAGNSNNSRTSWITACNNLTGYGYRKDVTIFEVIDSLPALGRVDQNRAKLACQSLLPLINSVVHHTDGKGTKHAIVSWFQCLCEISQADAGLLLARELAKNELSTDRRTESCLATFLESVARDADPMILASIYDTHPYSGSEEEMMARLTSIQPLINQDEPYGLSAYDRLLAHFEGDLESIRRESYEALQHVAYENGLPFPTDLHSLIKDHDEVVSRHRDDNSVLVQTKLETLFPKPVFSPFDSVSQVLVELRKINDTKLDMRASADRIAFAVGYRSLQLTSEENEESAYRIIEYFASNLDLDTIASLVAEIAGLLERHGFHDFAAKIYILAFLYSGGGNGYHTIGDCEIIGWLEQALRLSPHRIWGHLL